MITKRLVWLLFLTQIVFSFQNCSNKFSTSSTRQNTSLDNPNSSSSENENPAPAPITPSPSPSPNPINGESIYGATRTQFQSSGPIIATAGQVIEGLRISNPNGACITVKSPDVIIRNNLIGPCGVPGNDQGIGVFIENTSRITIQNNTFDRVSSGVYAISAQHPILIHHNKITNIRGPFPRGQFVQFNTVRNGQGTSKIYCNHSDVLGSEEENVEDHINMYSSYGTPENPIEISFNKVRGGHSITGSGIMTGDSSSAGGGGYVRVYRNTVVNVANTGIGVAGGEGMQIIENRVLLQGTVTPTRIGMYAYAYIPNGGTAPTCQNHLFQSNRVFAVDRIGQNGAANHFWHDTATCKDVVMTNNIFGDASLSPDIFQEIPQECL